jgi:hypothetical protein
MTSVLSMPPVKSPASGRFDGIRMRTASARMRSSSCGEATFKAVDDG